MSELDFILDEESLEEIKDICVVRLVTSCWSDKKGVHIKKSLIYLLIL